MFRVPVVFLLCLVALAACDDNPDSTPSDTMSVDTATGSDAGADADVTSPPEDTRVCVAIRGNGPRLFAHFGALARIHEHYGLIEGVAGGSSGSISSFLTESVYANPHVFDCGGSPCDDATAALRISLLFKSLQGYLGVLAGTDEALAFQAILPIIAAAQEQGIDILFQDGKLAEGGQALLDLLGSESLAKLVNPEALTLLAGSPDLAFHGLEIWEQIVNFGSFSTESDRIFVRPGVVSFDGLGELIGRIGSFYAAYGPADAAAWQDFFDACTPHTPGRSWAELSSMDAGDSQTCGERFEALLTTWRAALLINEASHPSRIDDPVGSVIPALISTSVLTGDSVGAFEAARDAYFQAQDYTFDINFDDVRFGYWGTEDDLAAVGANAQAYTDLKSAKFLSLGAASYREALSFSPAEPGLARALEIDATYVSAGGWSDLAPVLVLKNIGCETVILITREGPEQGGFGASVAQLLGMDAEDEAALYDMGSATSSIHLSLSEAEGVWCTFWDNFDGFDLAGVEQDAYNATLITTAPALISGDDPYANTASTSDVAGCFPGVTP